ncbi:hypothetical protein L6164_037335 [Bauhinia variegata]|uniref:Uncharacterized protein n=1 Tax=Bauhinia variegata TaxID=167791 RepID=A0ACB9KJT2_BAUVA|nr:hypothetical protein L6164_037335 [Bauhinia variegata]
MQNLADNRFFQFYEKWLLKLEKIANELIQFIRSRNQTMTNDSQLKHLFCRATSHIKEFYTVKWAEARENCLPFFAPVWLTPLENSYLWVTGFQPSAVVFPLVDTMMNQPAPVAGTDPSLLFRVTPEQARSIEELKIRIKREEEKVNKQMQRIHRCWSVADRRREELVNLTMQVKGRINLNMLRVAEGNALWALAMRQFIVALENTMKGADCARLLALKGVLDVLTPMQCLEFLASFFLLQLRLRQWGKAKLIEGSAGGGAASPATADEETKVNNDKE